MKRMNVDPGILEKCKSGDERACYDLYKTVYSYLYSVCLRYAQDSEEAKIFMNQGFSKAVLNLDKFRSNIPFKYWLRRITINLIIDTLRQRKAYKNHLHKFENKIKYLEDYTITVNSGAEQLEFEEILELLEHVPKTSKDIFNLFAIDGYSHAEIANMMHISIGTSKWHVSNARRILKDLIQKSSLIDLSFDIQAASVNSSKS